MNIGVSGEWKEVSEEFFTEVLSSRDYIRDNYCNGAIYYWSKPWPSKHPFGKQFDGRFYLKSAPKKHES